MPFLDGLNTVCQVFLAWKTSEPQCKGVMWRVSKLKGLTSCSFMGSVPGIRSSPALLYGTEMRNLLDGGWCVSHVADTESRRHSLLAGSRCSAGVGTADGAVWPPSRRGGRRVWVGIPRARPSYKCQWALPLCVCVCVCVPPFLPFCPEMTLVVSDTHSHMVLFFNIYIYLFYLWLCTQAIPAVIGYCSDFYM